MKKVLLILLPVIIMLGVGAVVGLNYIGILKIPFLPHKKVVKKASKKTVAAKTTPPVVKKTTPPPAPTPVVKPKKVDAPKPDVEAGEKKLATVWNEMDATQLVPIVQDWKDPELARILLKMDPGKVTELLAAVDPIRASKLSRAIETAAAKPKPIETPGA